MIRVALLFGGRSSEHSISCATAGGVLGAIDRERFEVVPVGITRDGAFTLQDDGTVRAFTLGQTLPELADNGTRVLFPESAATREFLARLTAAGIPATLRDTRGKEIDGACGQLVATEQDQAAAAAL